MTIETPPRPTKFADYTLVGFLGAGNDSQVFTAKSPERVGALSDLVALKILRETVTERNFRAAATELQCVRRIQSSAIISLYEVGRGRDSTMYCAMELACWRSLASPTQNLRRQEVLRAIARVARGAHALHEAGVIHGAIRPSNIMLTECGAKLADPDLTHLLWPERSFHASRPVSLVQYVDPGLIRGDAQTRASDIWALGTTLHVALTGKPIYFPLGPDLLQALRIALTRAPSLDWSLTPDETELIRACLAAEAGDRPTTALEVAERIEQIVGDSGDTESDPIHGAAAAQTVSAAAGPEGFEMVPLWTADLPTPRDIAARAHRHLGCPPMVEGILCKHGHLNYPGGSFCVTCGISLLQASRRLVKGRRPKLGVLVLDDGTICTLDADYVIGREPSRDPDVQEGQARPLRLDDQKYQVSAIHAEIRLDSWRVLLADRGSANGTFVRHVGEEQWTRLEGHPVELRPRTAVRVGEREFVFSSN